MSRSTPLGGFEDLRREDLPGQAGALRSHHAELILQLIVRRGGENDEECERLYTELEMTEAAIAALEAGTG
jgi:hypothetical protein